MRTQWLARVSGALAVWLLSGVGAWTVAEAAAASTLDNLQATYQNDATTKARYEAFAAKADAEGYKGISSLFRAAAMSEGIRAEKHAAAIRKLGAEPKASLTTVETRSTRENLAAALTNETAVKDTVYPGFIKQADAERNAVASRAFKGAIAPAASRVKVYQQALKDLDSWRAPRDVLVCKVCAYITADTTVKRCPICEVPRSKFETVR